MLFLNSEWNLFWFHFKFLLQADFIYDVNMIVKIDLS